MTPDRNRLRLLVMAGGAVGSVARFVTTDFVLPDSVFPWGTLIVNLVGSLGLGYLIGRSLARPLSPGRLALVGVGAMGALTTFGGVMVQMLDLFSAGHPGTAVVYLAVSLVAGIAAALVTLRVAAQR